MQTAALEATGLAREWSYEAIDVAPSRFAARVRAMPGEGFVGANVTVPHKLAALGLADEASEPALEIGAANTLTFGEGVIHADNTDAPGLLAAIGHSVAGRHALVLGAGGAARAAVWALSRAGAAVEIWNRNGARAEELAEHLAGIAVDAEAIASGPRHDVIVNATSVGLAGQGSPFEDLPLDPDRLGPGQTVVDMVYGDRETELVRTARARGAAVVDGIEVLVRQGAESFRIWTDEEPPLELMRRAARLA